MRTHSHIHSRVADSWYNTLVSSGSGPGTASTAEMSQWAQGGGPLVPKAVTNAESADRKEGRGVPRSLRRQSRAPIPTEPTASPPTPEPSSAATHATSARCARPHATAGPSIGFERRRKAAKRNLNGGHGCGCHSPPRAAHAAAASKATHKCLLISSAAAA